MRQTLTVLLVLTLLAACTLEKAPDKEYAVQSVRFRPAAAGEGGGPPSPEEPPEAAPADRKLIQTVDLELRVADTEAAAERIRELTEAAGGYVAEIDANRREGLLYFRLTLRIPAGRLRVVVDEIKGLAVEVERERLGTEDVTGRYVDLEARLKTLRATEEELRALLAESRSRGHKADDIMTIYRELTRIRTEIEQHQAQLDHLADRTSYSTVNLALRPTEAARPLVREGWQPLAVARGSFRTLLEVLQTLADLAIAFVVVVLPVGLILAVPVWLVVRAWRRRRSS